MQIISPIQETILKNFSQAIDSSHFYLSGGTALAYFYLRHRRSNDLDFFTATEEIVDPFSRSLEKVLRQYEMSIERRRGAQSFVELYVQKKDQGTIIHLGQDAAFRFEPTIEFPDYRGLRVDSLKDIASNKLLALFGRAALRDFIDIFFLAGKGGFTQTTLIQDAKKKDPGFDPYWLAVAFERIHSFHARSQDMLMLLMPLSFEDLTVYFDQWRRSLGEEFK